MTDSIAFGGRFYQKRKLEYVSVPETPPTAAAPALTTLDFDLADTAGGDSITITGTDLGSASSCTVGGTSATITANTSTSLTFTMPAKSAGSYNVQVTTAGGSSNMLSIEAWDPSEITSVDGYFDSRKGLTLSTNDVTSWLEQSRSAAYDLLGTGTIPQRVLAAFSTGAPAVRYSSSGRRHASSSNRAMTGAISVFWVAKWTSSSTTHAPYGVARQIAGDNGGWSSWGMYGDSIEYHNYFGANVFRTRGGVGDPGPGPGVNDGTTRLVGWTHTNGGTLTGYVNGAQSGTTASISYAPQTGWSQIGASYNNSNGADADVGAVILINAIISSDDLAKLHKWARVGFGAAA